MRDDADGLVAWLPTGTRSYMSGAPTGGPNADHPSTLFTAESVQNTGVWASTTSSRVAPTGRPWTVWVLFAEHTKEFAGWYVNLEDPHVRDAHTVYTRDHVLDLVIEPDRTVDPGGRGRARAGRGAGSVRRRNRGRLRSELAAAESAVASWASPFCEGWENFRPDPAWPIPGLPDRETL